MAGGHRLGPDPCMQKALAKRSRNRHEGSSGSNQEMLDAAVRLAEDNLERGNVNVGRANGAPSIDPRGQGENRAAVGHGGKAEAARSIAFDHENAPGDPAGSLVFKTPVLLPLRTEP